ncbi:MAG: type restriction enzyme subunit, partial [Chloroflexota bacterium]|nr:type restriction enzyme subunit [Chloroflexota bacterium]
SKWEHFNDWKKITSEGEQGVVSLETMLRGVCDPARLLDLIENFTLFVEERGGTIKLIAKNHQYLGVNNAFATVRETRGVPGETLHRGALNARLVRLNRSRMDYLRQFQAMIDEYNWRKQQQARAAVKLAIETALDRSLPPVYTPEMFKQKCEAVYLHVYDSYQDARRNVYTL